MKKQITKMMAAIMLLVTIVMPFRALAADETITFSQLGLTNGVQYTTINGTDCTLTFGDGANDGKYYNTGAAIRVYGGGHMTVSSTTKTIDKIELTFGSGDGSNTITTDVVTYSDGTWQGSAQSSVTFNVGGTSGHRRIASVAITYTSGGSQLTSTTTTITASQNFNDDLYVGTTAGTLTAAVTETGSGNAISGATVTWASSDQNVATVDNNGAVTLVAVGTTNITATYAGDQTYAGSVGTYPLTVVDNTPSTGTDVTFVAGTDTGASSVTKDGITVSMSTMSRTDNYRCYANSDMTVTSVVGKTITKVVLTCVSGNGANNFAVPTGCPGTYSYSQNNLTGTWTGSTSTVTLHASAQVRITQIVVTYETDNTPTITASPSTLNTFSYLSTSTDPSAAQSVAVTGANLTDDITASVGANSAFEISTAENGTYTNSLTLAESNGEVSTTIWVRMKANQTGNPTGTLTLSSTGASSVTIALNGSVVTPMTVAQAITAIDNATGNNVSNAYVTGIVSNIVTAYDSQHSNVTFDIVDAVGDQAYLRAYRCGGSYASTVAVGDVVVVSGAMTLYNNSIYEFTQGCQIVSLTPHQAQQYTLAVTSVTDAEIYVFDATNPDENQWVYLFDDVYSAQVTEGTPIALSVTADQGYAISELMVNGVNHVADINGGAYIFNMPSQNVTITVTAVQAYSITYSENGVETQSQVLSSTLTLPVGDDLDSEFSFAGWTTTPGNFVTPTTAGTQVNIQGGETFYAVYSRIEGREAYFEKVTEDLQDWSGNYLIVAVGTYANDEDYAVAFDGSLETLDATSNTIEVEIDENDHIEYDAEGTGVSYFSIAPIVESGETTGWSIQSASGYYIGRTANSNGMNTSDQTAYSHTIAISQDEEAVITSSGAAVLRYNKNANDKRFRYYKSDSYTNQQPIQLYKEVVVSQGTAHYFTRVFIMETPNANVTITGPSIIPSGSTLNMGNNNINLYNSNAANLIIEDGAQLIMHSQFNTVYATMQKNIVGCNYNNSNNAGYYLIASPVNGSPANVANMIPAANQGNYDLYYYDGSKTNEEWVNYKDQTDGGYSLVRGKGYLYANGANATLEFAGSINTQFDGFNYLDYDADNHFGCLNLVGNPFAYQREFCVYDYNYYDGQNTPTVNANYYSINSTGDGFIAGVITNGTIALDPMEAILIQTTNSNQHYRLLNDIYVIGGGILPSIPGYDAKKGVVNLNLGKDASDATIDRAIVRFDNGSMLPKFQLSTNGTKIYFTESGQEYAVVNSEAHGELPVSFKAGSNGTYTLDIEAEDVEMTYFHLIDNKTGNDVDLLQNSKYTFEANTGDNTSRFRLIFSANNSVNENAESFAFFNGSEWVISNQGDATLQVIDVMGRVLSNQQVNGNAAVRLNQSAGVYMLRLINGNNVMTQKIVVR